MGKRGFSMSKSGRRCLNPTDAFRKAERDKEKRRNKKERTRIREESLLKKDPSDVKDELATLKRRDFLGQLDHASRKRLQQLEAIWARLQQRIAESESAHQREREARAVAAQASPENSSSAESSSTDSDDDSDDSDTDSDSDSSSSDASERKRRRIAPVGAEESAPAEPEPKTQQPRRARWDVVNPDSAEVLGATPEKELPPDVEMRLQHLKHEALPAPMPGWGHPPGPFGAPPFPPGVPPFIQPWPHQWGGMLPLPPAGIPPPGVAPAPPSLVMGPTVSAPPPPSDAPLGSNASVNTSNVVPTAPSASPPGYPGELPGNGGSAVRPESPSEAESNATESTQPYPAPPMPPASTPLFPTPPVLPAGFAIPAPPAGYEWVRPPAPINFPSWDPAMASHRAGPPPANYMLGFGFLPVNVPASPVRQVPLPPPAAVPAPRRSVARPAPAPAPPSPPKAAPALFVPTQLRVQNKPKTQVARPIVNIAPVSRLATSAKSVNQSMLPPREKREDVERAFKEFMDEVLHP